MEEKNLKTEASGHNISSEDEKRINDVLIYEKWRDEGKYDHKKRDIEKKLKKQNAVKKQKMKRLEGKNE